MRLRNRLLFGLAKMTLILMPLFGLMNFFCLSSLLTRGRSCSFRIPKCFGNLAYQFLGGWNTGNHTQIYFLYRWFSRAWVIQEVALANKIVVRCSQGTLNFESMGTLSLIMRLSTNWILELNPLGAVERLNSTRISELRLV